MTDAKALMTQVIPAGGNSPSVHFAKDVTFMRAFIYALVCGENSGKISMSEFLAGCNRFGIDNPCPIMSKRLSTYGNTEEALRDFQKNAEKFEAMNPGIKVDREIYAPADLRCNDEEGIEPKKTRFRDFNETKSLSPIKKLGSIHNF